MIEVHKSTCMITSIFSTTRGNKYHISLLKSLFIVILSQSRPNLFGDLKRKFDEAFSILIIFFYKKYYIIYLLSIIIILKASLF